MPISLPLLERCEDPYATRRRADRGLVVPCPTGCLAYQPGVGRECLFVNNGAKVDRSGYRRVDPSRDGPQQQALFPKED